MTREMSQTKWKRSRSCWTCWRCRSMTLNMGFLRIPATQVLCSTGADNLNMDPGLESPPETANWNQLFGSLLPAFAYTSIICFCATVWPVVVLNLIKTRKNSRVSWSCVRTWELHNLLESVFAHDEAVAIPLIWHVKAPAKNLDVNHALQKSPHNAMRKTGSFIMEQTWNWPNISAELSHHCIDCLDRTNAAQFHYI